MSEEMTEQEFHSARQMFFVKDGTVLIAPKGYPYTHFEWLVGLFGSTEVAHEWIANYVRGYVYDKRFVAYTGTDFSHRVNHKDVAIALKAFQGIEEVGFGVIKGTTQPWEPKVLYDLEEYNEKSSRSN